MGAVPVALDQGAPAMLLLFLLSGALRSRSDPEAGLWLGLAASVSPRAWLALPWWLAQKRYAPLAVAVATWCAGAALAIPVLGAPAVRRWFTGPLPAMLSGDFTGANLRIDVFANHAPAHLWATLAPGRTGLVLSPAALGLTWLFGGAAALWLARAHRAPPPDRLAGEARRATWLLAVLALPVFAHEALVPLALPAVALAVTGLWRGRLSGHLAVPLGVALAALCAPVDPLRQLHHQVLLPDLPALAPALRELKPLALLFAAGCAARLSLAPPKGATLGAP